MITIENLYFKYREAQGFELKIKELKIADGEKCCIVGPSGSGKTTLVNLLTGIYKPVSGTIRIDNMDISDRNEKEIRGFRINSIGYIFQDFGLIDYLNVEDNILLPVYLSPGMSVNRSMKERVDYLLTRLNLGDKRSSFSRQLSQGEKQRVSIARAVLLKPRIIIGDEATGNLDAKTTEKIMELLLEVVAESGSTFIFITHNLLLMKYFKRVIDIIELNK